MYVPTLVCFLAPSLPLTITEEISETIKSNGGVAVLNTLMRTSSDDNVEVMSVRALRNLAEFGMLVSLFNFLIFDVESIRQYLEDEKTLEFALEKMKTTEDDDNMVAEYVGLVLSLTESSTSSRLLSFC